MKPIGLLMIEHRLTERMLKVMAVQAQRMAQGQAPGPGDIAVTLDFVRTFIDRSHHGKEENLLFKALSMKPLQPEHEKTMRELIEEHGLARRLLASAEDAFRRYVRGESGALPGIAEPLRELSVFYQTHIDKEDRHFFLPSMEYFSSREQDAMDAQSRDYDARVFHDIYREAVDAVEKRAGERPAAAPAGKT
ncbi:MAG: hemerythrin domain-containing protein [Endomicrobiales bacterium]